MVWTWVRDLRLRVNLCARFAGLLENSDASVRRFSGYLLSYVSSTSLCAVASFGIVLICTEWAQSYGTDGFNNWVRFFAEKPVKKNVPR